VLKPRFATYTIRTTPEDATVYIDGKRLDPVSRTKQRIESGSHTIRVERQDYHTQEQKIELKDGDDETFVFHLIPTFGELSINATPVEGTSIYINGIAVKTNPYQNKRQPSGKYTIRAENEWYHAQEKIIELGDGKKASHRFDLEPAFGEVAITTTPGNARVYLDGVLLGNTPIPKRRIKSGTYTLKIEKALYHTRERTLEIKDGDDRNLPFDLGSAFGALVVHSEPEEGAAVIIDGKEVGTTPYVNRAVQFYLMPA